MPNELLTKLATRKAVAGEVVKAASSTPTTNYNRGSAGLFNQPRANELFVNAVINPFLGLAYALPVRGSLFTNPVQAAITGIGAASGDEPTGKCGDFPTVGTRTICRFSLPFGRVGRSSQVLDRSRAGKRQDAGDARDFRVLGAPNFGQNNPFAPTLPAADYGEGLNSIVARNMHDLRIAMLRANAPIIYNGDPANNTDGDPNLAGYMEPYGLYAQITTGRQDIGGTACAALDSMIYDFGSQNISTGGTAIEDDLVAQMSAMHANAQRLAEDAGMAPCVHAWVMHPSTFYELLRFYPRSYYTIGGAVNVTMNDATVVNMRNDMYGDYATRTGQFLMMNGGQRVPVILDDSVPLTKTGTPTATVTGTILLLAMTARGTPVTYIEYFNYANAEGTQIDRFVVPNSFFSPTDNGQYLLIRNAPTGTCVQASLLTEWRVVVNAPYLCGRIDNVAADPVRVLRDWEPGDPDYVAGGISTMPAPSDSTPSA